MTEESTAFGPNAWLVDEMLERYRRDPSSVSESWQEFFSDVPAEVPRPAPAEPPAAAPASPESRSEPAKPSPTPAPAAAGGEAAQPLRGAAARVVANMEASLSVPTATSVRQVPAKLIEVNRRMINNHLARGDRKSTRLNSSHV